MTDNQTARLPQAEGARALATEVAAGARMLLPVSHATSEAEPSDESSGQRCAILVDYDNFYEEPPGSREGVTHEINRMVSLAVDAIAGLSEIHIRFYGGWLEAGVLTKRGSALQAGLGSDYFPLTHPDGSGMIRGSIVLVTRLAAVPGLEWTDTFRTRRGLPRLRLTETPRPKGCANAGSCPIDQLQRISRRRDRECHITGCSVMNKSAFLLAEQKMVDSLMCCDTIAFSQRGTNVIVLSNDLDVLPALAMAASVAPGPVVLVRGQSVSEGLYDDQLRELGVSSQQWDAA